MFSPLMALLYVVVKADSRGPFLYSQQRPGYRGVTFTAYKIRTMTVGADRDPTLAHAVTSDCPEVTRTGRILRDLKLDELPQLWNVVRGEMVFVGPRPIAPGLQVFLESRIPGFRIRLTAPPGLTSLGQVCIDENESAEHVVRDWSVRFEAERHYLANRSIAYDLVIISMTVVYCLRKVWRRLPGLRIQRGGAIPALLLTTALLFSGRAPSVSTQDMRELPHGSNRLIPVQLGDQYAAIPEDEAIPVETRPRGRSNRLDRSGSGNRLSMSVFGQSGMVGLTVRTDGAGEIQSSVVERVEATSLTSTRALDSFVLANTLG
jgi:lipopolysaccharide/colanic/teichoic acid biosynthesis glycosyltransferase